VNLEDAGVYHPRPLHQDLLTTDFSGPGGLLRV
jgi:hypothetical protein